MANRMSMYSEKRYFRRGHCPLSVARFSVHACSKDLLHKFELESIQT